MSKILNTAVTFLALYGGFTYLNYLDTKTEFPDKKLESDIGEINLSQIAKKTRPARDKLVDLTSSIWRTNDKTPKTQTQEIQTPEQNPQYNKKRPYPENLQRFHRRRTNF